MKNFLVNIIILFSLGACISNVQAQNKRITGIVTDKAGGPLAGISVLEKGSPSNGTSTTADGKFNLILKAGNTIIVQGLGFLTKEMNVSGKTDLTVVLEADVKQLEDVVVVGYGTQKKITLTGAASAVTGTELRQNPTASVQNTMIGILPGFVSQQRTGTPGSDGADFYIRGQSSFAGANQPLIIVDDIEFSYAQFSTLSANEIESITILKDASTTAQYGIKGANGVVVVTTRRGKLGKPSISFTSELALMQPTILPKFLNSYQVASIYDQAQTNDNLYAPDPNFTPKFSAQDLALFQSGADPYGHPNVNWENVLFKKFSMQERENFDISGGTDRVKYFVSLGYLNQGGILKDFSDGQGVNSNFYNQRYNYRSNLDMNLNKNLSLRVDLSGSISAVNNPNVGGAFGDIFTELGTFKQLSPFAYPVYNPNGSLGYSVLQQTFFGSAYNTNNVVGRLTYDGYNRTYGNNMNLNATANQKLDFLTKGLALKGVMAYGSTYSYTRSMTRASSFPSYIYDPVANTYTPRDPTQLTIPRFGMGYSGGSTIRTLTLQGSLNYDRTFGLNHFSGLVLFNQSSNTSQNSTVAYNFVPANSRGLTARFGYDYKQKYLLQVSGAYNGTNRFVAEKRYGLFPAVSAGWNVAEESFVKNNIKFLYLFKLRASYGLVGSDQLPSGALYAYNQTYTAQNGIGSYPGSFGTVDNPYTGIQEGTLANDNVTWEKEKKMDLGLDFGLFNGKVSGVLDYFNDNRFDILTTRADVSAVFGQSLPPVNLGRVNNRGFEAELDYRNTIGKDFTYSVKMTYTYAKNKILYEGEPLQLYPWMAATGKSIGSKALYQFQGYYQSVADIQNSPVTPSVAIPGDLKYADLNHDGVINGYDEAVSDYSNFPQSIYGMQFGFGYKGFNLSVLFQAATQFLQAGVGQQIIPFTGNLQPVQLQAWTPALGNAARFPVIKVSSPGFDDGAAYPSTFWYRSGDYLRFKTADLSYSIPDKFVKKFGIHGARIYVSGYNLLTWSPSHFGLYQTDPEAVSGSSSLKYPPQRTYNAGLNVTF